MSLIYINNVEQPGYPFHKISFRLAGIYHEMSLQEFSVRSGLYTVQELNSPVYTEGTTMYRIRRLEWMGNGPYVERYVYTFWDS